MRVVLLAALIALVTTTAVAQEGPSWTIRSRWDLPMATVPMWQPTTPGHAMTIDVAPKGRPAGNFKAGIHTCDTDLEAHIRGEDVVAGITCNHIAAHHDSVQFGIARFGTVPEKPINIVDTGYILAAFTREAGGARRPRLKVGPFDSLAIVDAAAQVAALRRENDRLIQRVVSMQRAQAVLRARLGGFEDRLRGLETGR